MGRNSWFNNNYSIGTPVLGMCFNIGVAGSITAPYKLQTPCIHVDILRGHVAAQITIDDDVILTGNTTIRSNTITRGFTCECAPAAVSQNTSSTLSYAQLRHGIITGLNIATGLTYTLPFGSSMGSNMDWLGNGTVSQYGQSFQWIIINMYSTTGNINIVDSVGHSYVGDKLLTTSSSSRLLTIYTALHTCIAYRICN